MLNNDYTEKLIGLKDVILDNVEEIGDTRHIYLHMPQRINVCPRCGCHTSKVHDYRVQKVKDIPAYGLQTISIFANAGMYVLNAAKSFKKK